MRRSYVRIRCVEMINDAFERGSDASSSLDSWICYKNCYSTFGCVLSLHWVHHLFFCHVPASGMLLETAIARIKLMQLLLH